MASGNSRKEWFLVFVVALMSVSANLPDDLAQRWSIDRHLLLIALTVTVVFALFRYLKFMLFLVVSIMAVGANLPTELASRIGVDPLILLISLGALIVLSFFNYMLKLLPTGLEEKQTSDSVHGGKVLMTAVGRGDLSLTQRLLDMGVNVNAQENGSTPLIEAAQHGYSDLVQLLLENGADPGMRNTDGRTALEMSLLKGFTRTAEILKRAQVAQVTQAKGRAA